MAGAISSALNSSAAPKWVTIVRSPSGEMSDTHLPERSLPRKTTGATLRFSSAWTKKSPVVSCPTLPMKPTLQPSCAMARMVLPAEPPSESE